MRVAWFPHQGARGTVVLSPGRTEPIERYFEVIGELHERGFAVAAHDWRGQGLSDRGLPDPLKGHARGWAPFVSDYRDWLGNLEAVAPRPWLALGHSMGGALILLALLDGERRLDGAVLSAPMLKVQTGRHPYPLVRTAAFAAARLGGAGGYAPGGPGDPAGHTFEQDALTHDRARWERWRAQLAAEPRFALGGVTWGWLNFACAASARVARPGGLERIDIPVTIVAAGEEIVVDNAAARRAAGRLPRGRYVEVEGARHEVLMETDPRRAQFWAAFDALADGLTPPSA